GRFAPGWESLTVNPVHVQPRPFAANLYHIEVMIFRLDSRRGFGWEPEFRFLAHGPGRSSRARRPGEGWNPLCGVDFRQVVPARRRRLHRSEAHGPGSHLRLPRVDSIRGVSQSWTRDTSITP